MEVTTQPCGLTKIDSANLGERSGEQQGNKRSQINFGSRDARRIEGPILPPFVCSSQADVFDHGLCRPGLLDQQTKLPHQISSHPQFPMHAPGLASGRFSFALHAMFAARCRHSFHEVQTFHSARLESLKDPASKIHEIPSAGTETLVNLLLCQRPLGNS